MNTSIKIIKKYPLSSFCILCVWLLSLTPWIPETPLNEVRLIDKWTHIVMYFGIGACLWFEFIRNKGNMPFPKLLLCFFVLPSLMGGLLELLQAYCTFGHRSGEWMDFIADAIGAFLSFVVGLFIWLRVNG